jgi:replicative DNA helicase
MARYSGEETIEASSCIVENSSIMASFAALNLTEGLPASIHTEVVILGAMLLDGVAINDAMAKLIAEDFALDSHRRIYRSITKLVENGHAVDYITVRDELAKSKELESIGGPAYLAFLTEGIPRNPRIEDYVRIVKDKSLLRQVMSICQTTMARAADQEEDALEVLNSTEQQLLEVSEKGITRGFASIEEIVAGSFGTVDQLYAQGREITGLATHYTDFDRMTSGLQPSELIIIAARPSMGKTAWAINIAQNSAVRDGKVVAVFSLEMSKESLLRRLLASQAMVNVRSIQTGFLGRDDLGQSWCTAARSA